MIRNKQIYIIYLDKDKEHTFYNKAAAEVYSNLFIVVPSYTTTLNNYCYTWQLTKMEYCYTLLSFKGARAILHTHISRHLHMFINIRHSCYGIRGSAAKWAWIT